MTLYLFALPLTLVSDLGWTMVPIVTVVAFTFMGIEGIADEIEMPFGQSKHFSAMVSLTKAYTGNDTGDLPLGNPYSCAT